MDWQTYVLTGVGSGDANRIQNVKTLWMKSPISDTSEGFYFLLSHDLLSCQYWSLMLAEVLIEHWWMHRCNLALHALLRFGQCTLSKSSVDKFLRLLKRSEKLKLQQEKHAANFLKMAQKQSDLWLYNVTCVFVFSIWLKQFKSVWGKWKERWCQCHVSVVQLSRLITWPGCCEGVWRADCLPLCGRWHCPRPGADHRRSDHGAGRWQPRPRMDGLEMPSPKYHQNHEQPRFTSPFPNWTENGGGQLRSCER